MKYLPLFLLLVHCGEPAKQNTGANGSTGSTGSLTWTQATITGADAASVGNVGALTFGGGKFVAFARANIGIVGKNSFALTSADGKTWSISATFAEGYAINDMVYTGGRFVGVGTGPDGTGGGTTLFAESSDGVTWTFTNAPGAGSTAITSVGTTVVAAGEAGSGNYRTGAAAPVAITLGTSKNIEALCTVGTRVISVGPGDAALPPPFLFSDTPTAGPWSQGTFNTTDNPFMRGLACDDTRQVAVGSAKNVFVSTNKGASWTLRTKQGDSTTLNAVVFVGSKTIAVGNNGAYGLVGADDVVIGTMGTTRNFGAIATNGTLAVAASSGTTGDAVQAVFYYSTP